MIRLASVIIAGFITLNIFWLPAYLGPDDLKRCEKPAVGTCEAADAIVTVSGGDTIARTDEAIKLYKEGWGDKLIFSGAAADTSGPSNALAMKRYAVAVGVSEFAISTEEFSQNTAENAVNTSLFIKRNNLRKIILVTSAYHQRRANLEFRVRLGPDITIVNHPVARDRQWSPEWFLHPHSISLAYGELGRIIIFYINRGTSF